MKVVKTKAECIEYISAWRRDKMKIGFVPTMGALHEGHISLVDKSCSENEKTIVSIFVNPTQFNNKTDLEKYPRNLDLDAEMLSKHEVDIIFAPDVDEIYPDKNDEQYDLGGLDLYMEGKHRPGHFQGVAMVIDRLFKIITADNAYFGEKDFQQLAIIRYITKNLGFNTNIIGCPIIRDHEGLALSSRNLLLNEECKKNAPKIYEALKSSKEEINKYPIVTVKKNITEKLNSIACFDVEYFEIVDAYNLTPIEQYNPSVPTIGCIAVWANKVRLIDNIIYMS